MIPGRYDYPRDPEGDKNPPSESDQNNIAMQGDKEPMTKEPPETGDTMWGTNKKGSAGDYGKSSPGGEHVEKTGHKSSPLAYRHRYYE